MMTVSCIGGSAVVWHDRIYVMGGEDGKCMSYDPAKNRWDIYSRPHLEHRRGKAVLWKDRILLCGGTETSVIEEYDPVTNTWSTWEYELPEGVYDCQVFASSKMIQPISR